MSYKAVVLAVFVMIACTPDELTTRDYISYIRMESDLPVNGHLGDCPFTLIYKPQDYLVALEAGGKNITAREYEAYREKFSDALYVDVNMGRCDSLDRYDIFLMTALDSLVPSFHHRESNGGAAPYVTDLYIFPNWTSDRDLKFCLVRGGEKSYVQVSKEKINALPKLKI